MDKKSLRIDFWVILGFILAARYGRSTKKFLWREYFALLVAPAVGLVGLIILFGTKPLFAFITLALIGPASEWLLGFMYHKTLGTRLWLYERYCLPGRYTSWLTIPMWGFAGIFLQLVFEYF